MQKAGGVIAIIAGIFGIFAAGATLLIGGLSGALNTEGATTVIGLGWGGVFFSFLTIVLGAIALNASTKKPGIFLILITICGAIFGGTLVAIFMALGLIGGILATLGAKSKHPPLTNPTTSID